MRVGAPVTMRAPGSGIRWRRRFRPEATPENPGPPGTCRGTQRQIYSWVREEMRNGGEYEAGAPVSGCRQSRGGRWFSRASAGPDADPTPELLNEKGGLDGEQPTQHGARHRCSCIVHMWVAPAKLQWCADAVGVAPMATTVSKTHHSARSETKCMFFFRQKTIIKN